MSLPSRCLARAWLIPLNSWPVAYDVRSTARNSTRWATLKSHDRIFNFDEKTTISNTSWIVHQICVFTEHRLKRYKIIKETNWWLCKEEIGALHVWLKVVCLWDVYIRRNNDFISRLSLPSRPKNVSPVTKSPIVTVKTKSPFRWFNSVILTLLYSILF